LSELDTVKNNFDKAIANMESRLVNVRAGRANPSMLDGIMADFYGTPSPIRNMAQISVPEARQLFIKPFDKGNLKNIEQAIIEADLGIMPTNNGEFIILTIPELTEERRIEYVRDAKAITEDGKIAIRNLRHEALKKLANDQLGEDNLKTKENEIQDLVNEYNQKIDNILKDKESELMTI